KEQKVARFLRVSIGGEAVGEHGISFRVVQVVHLVAEQCEAAQEAREEVLGGLQPLRVWQAQQPCAKLDCRLPPSDLGDVAKQCAVGRKRELGRTNQAIH